MNVVTTPVEMTRTAPDPHSGRCVRLCRGLLAALVGLVWWQSAVAAPVFGVIFPDVREPYRSIFSTITDGISAEIGAPLRSFLLHEEDTTRTIERWIEAEHIELVIALGKHGKHVVEGLSAKVPVVYGALAAVSNEEVHSGTGILLIPSPEVLFAQLLTYAPDTKVVYVVYNPRHNQWLIDHAQAVAGRLGLRLEARAADNLATAAKSWRQIILKSKEKRFAMWLLQDASVIDDRAILSMILKESWERGLVTFSSNPAHVKRGVLFSLYSDNFRMGRSIGRLALGRLRGDIRGGDLVPTTDVSVAFNTRTAEHLGVVLTDNEKQGIELVFPGP